MDTYGVFYVDVSGSAHRDYAKGYQRRQQRYELVLVTTLDEMSFIKRCFEGGSHCRNTQPTSMDIDATATPIDTETLTFTEVLRIQQERSQSLPLSGGQQSSPQRRQSSS
jgi:hypothetical protein